ncbi:Wzz/FepE/Etk N-terminal domain-containing protein [Prevotella sp. P6B4]|uniref:GumC family protein n=1 Tax=Prevotella sp. P6B4 TaxID=1410614 RepID=UPI00048B194C|nr:Wzz/FepE/Etk N-terminal domain-containing protein [Prevotella sp. P6B4]
MDLQQYLYECKRHWRWFVASTTATILIAILFLLTTVSQYERSATILVKDENGGSGLLSSMSANMGMLAGMAGINIASNVNNEMEILSSPSLLMEVVNRLGLDTHYEMYDGLMKRELWEETLPVKLSFPKLSDKDGASMKMDLHQDGTFTLYKIRKDKDKVDEEIPGKVNTICQTPIGPISVIATKHFKQVMDKNGDMTIHITKEKKFDQVEGCMKTLDVSLANDQTNIIHIGYQDQIAERAELIINTLIKVYQDEWMKDKQSTADISTKFINERIKDIEQELSGLDKNIAQFKGSNLMPDYEEAAKMYMANAALTYEQQVKVNNQLYIMEQMRQQVNHTEGSNQVLPANLLPDNDNVAKQINEYNKLQLQRNQMADNSSENNPLVKDLDAQLGSMRKAIVNSLDHSVAQLKASQKAVNREDQKLKQQISAAPSEVTKVLPAERQHKIIEALYIYLLEKREENSLTQVYNSQNLRIVSPPMGKLKPIFPKKGTSLLIALFLGLAIPAFYFYLKLNVRSILKEA